MLKEVLLCLARLFDTVSNKPKQTRGFPGHMQLFSYCRVTCYEDGTCKKMFRAKRRIGRNFTIYVRALDSVTQSAGTDDVTVSSSLQQLMTSSVTEAAAVAETLAGLSTRATRAGDSTHALSTPSPHFRSHDDEASRWSTAAVETDDLRPTRRQARRTQSTADVT